MAGFSMTAFVELQVSNYAVFSYKNMTVKYSLVKLEDKEEDPIPIGLLLTFVVVVTLTVTVHVTAVFIAAFLLPSMDALTVCEDKVLAKIRESHHPSVRFFIEMAWICSNVIGIILFLMEMILVGWIHFWYVGDGILKGKPGRTSALGATIIILFAIVFFFWYTLYYYQRAVKSSIDHSMRDIRAVESDKRKFSIWAKARVSSTPECAMSV